MPRVASTPFSFSRSQAVLPELQTVTHHQLTGFSNNFNRGNHVRSRHGTAPYPRPQNVWIRCNIADLNDSFCDLRLKVTKSVLLLDSND